MTEKVRVIEQWRKPTSLDKAEQKTIWKHQYGDKQDGHYASVSYFLQVNPEPQYPNWQPVGSLLEYAYESKITGDPTLIDVLCKAYPHMPTLE